ncbi:hypothetical protein SBOR_0878 [Sclerotinia borealis F-4128]|uniref:Uncharacterized protein n=1 Tax=Sclerotinia borealis (strain F-4128) TaxID=1432307 RepID=W9CVR5_SCLBF|nr:hypothetical protein SBOR_0878 [Sclerotinia borealis F-4128]
MSTSIHGTATSTIFNVSKYKYGPASVFAPAASSTSTASGWSPTGHLPPGAKLATIEEEKRIEDFQRDMLYDFTVRELVDFDVVSSRILEEGNLTNPIHPIFSRNVWEKPGQRPLSWHITIPEMTIEGVWYIMDDPTILKAMIPVLTLASTFLSRMHALPFFDALFLGRRDSMPQSSSTIPLPNGLVTFWRRDLGASRANDFAECNKSFGLALRRLHKMLKWGFALGTQMPWDVLPKQSNCLGVTYKEDANTIWIFLDQRLCDLLLRNDLTSAEKAGAEYSLAIVMCHELTHVLCYIIQDKSLNRNYEPFYEDAPQCELGFEMENSVFGGLIEPIFPTPAAPFAYAVDSTYPAYGNMQQRVPGTLVMDKAMPYHDQSIQYFIPIQTFEDIRKQAFWDRAIRRYGLSTIHARAIKYGWKVDFSPDWKNVDLQGCPSFSKSPLSRIGYLQGIQLDWYDDVAASAAVYNGKQLPPVRKSAFQMLEEVIESALREEQFYDFTQAQEDKLWQVRESFVSLREAQNTNDTVQANKLARDLIKMLRQAIVNHKESFVLLERSETLRGGKNFRDRRATLFRWNTGTRRLLNDLFTVVEDVPNRQGDLEATFQELKGLLCNLEYVRLQIFPPTSTWVVEHENTAEGIEELKKWPKDFFREELNELNFIADLCMAATKSHPDECRNLAKVRLQSHRGASTLSFYCRFLCVNLLKIEMPNFMGQHWKERKKAVDDMIPWLQKLQEGCTGAWNLTFVPWIRWYEHIGSRSEEEERMEEEKRMEEEERERERLERIMQERRKRRTRY